MINILSKLNLLGDISDESAEKLKKTRKELKKLFDSGKLFRKSKNFLITDEIKVLNERESNDYSVYAQIFSFIQEHSVSYPDLECTVNVKDEIINISIKEFGSGQELLTRNFLIGFSHIESFEFWKIGITGYKGEDLSILTLPL